MTLINKKTLTKIINNPQMRTSLTKDDVSYFAAIYFPHYFDCDFAPFQKQMIEIIQDKNCQFSVVIAFRDSGKSTLFTTIAPLWHIMGSSQKKFIVLVSQTQEQVGRHMANIKAELESNELLKNDLGPFKETSNKWSSMTLEFSKYKAQITAVSIDQSVRGMRYRQYRPDLIICDDIEDSQSVKTEEGRKHTQELYSGEIVPLGKEKAQIIMVGNYLHPSGLLSNLTRRVKTKKIIGKTLFIPLVTEDRQITWPQKFPTMSDIKRLKEKIADERIWSREYLLKTIANEDCYYTHENIHFYSEIPSGWEPHFKFRAAGMDLAIAEGKSNDYTAIVTADIYKIEGKYKIFILPYLINKRVGFKETLEIIRKHTKFGGKKTHIFVESTGYQKAVVQQLADEDLPISAIEVAKAGKKERLSLNVDWHLKGHIFFPDKGGELLVNQLTGFGYEKHDDLVDAFSLLMNEVIRLCKKDKTPENYNYNGPIVINTICTRPELPNLENNRDSSTFMNSFMRGFNSTQRR